MVICDEMIVHYGVYAYVSDMDCFQPLMDGFHKRYGFYPKYPVADAGYGSFKIHNFLRMGCGWCVHFFRKKYSTGKMHRKCQRRIPFPESSVFHGLFFYSLTSHRECTFSIWHPAILLKRRCLFLRKEYSIYRLTFLSWTYFLQAATLHRAAARFVQSQSRWIADPACRPMPLEEAAALR